MSSRKLFEKNKTDKVITSTDIQTLGEDVESEKNMEQRFKDVNRFIPQIDFSNPENFAKFGSAEKYYTDAIDRIIRSYPYDGAESEINQFFNESNYIDDYIFENLYPRTTGYATFSPHDTSDANGGWGANDTSPVAANRYYGEPTNKEYIEVRGGPHTASYGMPSGSIPTTFTGSNYYSTDIYNKTKTSPIGRDGTRESNLRMNLDDGITVEFWLKKESFITSKTQKEVIFDLWNQVTSSSPQYGRLRVELTGSGYAEDGANPFRFTLISGAFSGDAGFSEVPFGGTTITTASVADNKWHHYAFSVVKDSTANTIRFYKDGTLVDTVSTGSVMNEITGSLMGFVGALQTPPSRSATPGDSMVGWGKLSGSLDEFRYWKVRRTSEEINKNYFTQVRGGTNDAVANTELGVYYKFNEGVVEDSSVDSVVLDYSGRISNGIWVGYASDARSTGSAIVEFSGSNLTEYKDPIIYHTHPDVQTLRNNLIASASYHDTRNNTSLYYSMPSWIIEEDSEKGKELLNLTQILGNYFDTLYLQVQSLPDIHAATYTTSSGKPLPFANRLLESKGFLTSEIFANAEIIEAVKNRDSKREFAADLHETKNLIYKNIYNNLVHIYKTKGTEKSFRNLIRCFGVDEDVVRINMYADNVTQLLRDNFRVKSVKKNFVNFHQSDNFDAVVTHQTSSQAGGQKNSDSIGITYISASHVDISTTAESEVVFPRLKQPGDPGYVELTFASSSIFGWDQADPDPDDFVKPSGGSGYQVLAVRPDNDSKDASFYLIDRSNNATIATSSLYKGVYDDQRWTFALRTRNAMTSSITPTDPATSHGMGTFLTGAAGIRAKATITVIDSSSPPGTPFIGEGDTIVLISTDGTTVTLTMQGTGGSTTSTGTSGATLTAKTLSAGSYANSTLHATAQAVEIRIAINHHTKFSATNTANVISIVQAEPGTSGNTTLTITEIGATGMSNTNFAGGANANRVEVSLYGVHTAYDRIQEEFALSGNAIHSDITVPRRYYVGARRTNVTGTLQENSSVRVGYLRHWQMYLDNKVVQAHARDTENYGTRNPLRSAYLLETPLTGVWMPEYETLALNWDFSNVTGSDADGEFVLRDFSSGSLTKRRFRDPDIDPIVNNQYNARGYFFKTSTTAAVDTNYISSARYRLPEVMNSQDMIEIRTEDDLTFTRETRPIDYFFAFEKSMYQTISEEMLNMFAGITEFNNLIGTPTNRYRHEYKDLSKLRQIFHERVENTPDLDKYLSYYKWIDTALGQMLQQLVPGSSKFSDDIRNVIEDTILTRSKYRHILPTLKTPDLVIEGQVKGIHEHIYNWNAGHAPMNSEGTKVVHPQPQDKNCLWWQERAERMGVSLSSDKASVDRSAALVAIIDEQREAYKRKGFSFISASVPQFTALQGTDGVTKVGVNNIPIYTGSYYPNNKFSKIYRLTIGFGAGTDEATRGVVLYPGHNPPTATNSKYTFWRKKTAWNDTTRFVDITNIEDYERCRYSDRYPLKGTYPIRPENKRNLLYKVTDGAGETYKGVLAPFSLYKTAITTGYKSTLSSVNIRLKTGGTTAGGLEVNNLHQDVYETHEIPLQGPFTEKFVGGLSHRHVDLNTSKDGSLDSLSTRLEGWKFTISSNGIRVLHQDTDKPRGGHYRNAKVKRSVNIRNIQQLTGSGKLNSIGNFTNHYEIVQTSDRDINNRAFVKHEGAGQFNPGGDGAESARGYSSANPAAKMGEFSDAAKPNFSINSSSVGQTDFVIVERFSAPGGPETAGDTNGGPALDYASGQYSPYNNLNYRNLTVRLPLRRLLTEHANQFGFSSEPDALKATATITVTVANVDNIGQGDTIELTATNGKTITCTLQGVGGTTTSTATDGNVQAAIFASGTDNTLQATSQAVAIATAINSNNFFTATNNANVVTVTQAVGGGVGNTAITITELGATGLTKTDFQGGAGRASTVNSFDYRGIPAFHNVNRNSTLRYVNSGSRTAAEAVVRAQTHDNYWISREIPQSDTQYAWITASLVDNEPTQRTVVLGHPHPDGMHSSSVSYTYRDGVTIGPGFIPAYNFVSASDYVTKVRGANNKRTWGNANTFDKSVNDSAIATGFFITDFVGMNGNIAQVIDTDSLTLTGSTESAVTDKVHFLYVNTILASVAGEFVGTMLAEAGNPDISAPVLNALTLNRNGPYGYPSWKQIRTGETRIGRYLRRNNIISYNETPGSHIVSEDRGRGRSEKIGRFGALKKFTEAPVVSKYLPTTFKLGMKVDIDRNGKTVTRVRPINIDATYGNEMCFFSNAELDEAKGFIKQRPTGYSAVGNFYLKGGLEDPSTPVESFIEFKYRETIYPKGENAYLGKVRKRNSYANNFWRTSRKNRDALGKKKINFISQTADSLDFATGEAITGPGTKRSSWNLDGLLDGAFTTASVSIFNVLTGSETGILQDYSAILHHGQLQNITASCLYARPHLLSATSSLRSFTGPNIAETGSASMIIAGHPLGRMKVYGGITSWEAGHQAGVVDAGGTFVSRSAAPAYDTYDDYCDDLRTIGQDYALIPEFRISEHMEFYVNKSQGDFLAENPKLLSIFGSPTGSSVPQNSSENNFFRVFSTTDFMKHFTTFRDEHKEVANPTEITLTCKTVAKFLPYDGFYPAERTVEIATQFSKSVTDHVRVKSVGNTDSSFGKAGIRPLITPLFAPGVLFNTIKSGIAVDYPVYTSSFRRTSPKDGNGGEKAPGYLMITTSSTGPRDSAGKLSGWHYRVPFETLAEPERYIRKVRFVDMEVHPSASLRLSASWDGNGDNLFKLMSNNFLAEVPSFFLPDGEFSTIRSTQEKNFVPFDTGSVYGMRIKVRKSYNRSRQPASLVAAGYPLPQDTIIDGIDRNPPLRETFTMYSRPSAFGPPVSGRGPDLGNSGAPSAAPATTYNRVIQPDSLMGINPSFTPPYYDGEAWCDVVFRPSSSAPTLDDIFSVSKMFYWRFDKLKGFDLGGGTEKCTNNTHPYGNININKFAMQLSSSFNLFQKITEPGVEFDKDGNPITVSTHRIGRTSGNSSWVIQPKFETPMFNFGDTGVHPIKASTGTLTIPTNNSESVTRGMWHQFGVIPKDPHRGIFLEIGEIPKTFLSNRVPLFISASYGSDHSIDVNAGTYDDTEIAAVYNGGKVRSLLDHIKFDIKSVKLGKTAQRKCFHEAIVAVPFVETEGERQFFKVDKALIKAVIDDKNTDLAGDSIKAMVAGMKKFIIPPTMDSVAFHDAIEPIAMYFFDFQFEFNQNDLAHIWQNLAPPCGRIVKKSRAKVSHKLLLNEIFGNVGQETGEPIDDRLKWLVFKAKQRANRNYFSKVAGEDADERFTFKFRAGRSGEEIDRKLEFSYNWPYDFFSMIELAKLESEIKFAPIDEDVDDKLIINTDQREVSKGVRAQDPKSPTPRLPKKE